MHVDSTTDSTQVITPATAAGGHTQFYVESRVQFYFKSYVVYLVDPIHLGSVRTYQYW